MSAFDEEEYYENLERVIIFIKNKGLPYITDVDEQQECKKAVDWLLESGKKGTGFALSARYFRSAVRSKCEECVNALKDSDLDSKEYRDAFSVTFMTVVNDLSFIPKPRKEQIRKVVEGEKKLSDEIECITLLQDLLYSILPKYFKISSKEMRARVAALSDVGE